MIYTELHIYDLDGAVTLFKSTDEGTETIAVFDEEHREVIQDLLAEVKRLREVDEIKFTIDDYDKVVNSEYKGYYVTLYINGCEYIGALRLYKDEEGKVIE